MPAWAKPFVGDPGKDFVVHGGQAVNAIYRCWEILSASRRRSASFGLATMAS